MKIKPEHQEALYSLFYKSAREFYGMELEDFIEAHKNRVKSGEIKAKCNAWSCFWRLSKGDALSFICDEIYPYANDDHLRTFYGRLYEKR